MIVHREPTYPCYEFRCGIHPQPVSSSTKFGYDSGEGPCIWSRIFHLLEFLQLSDALLFIVTENGEKGLAMGFLRYEYLGPEVLAGFDTYKYSCRDTSPLSNYVMHPFWNQCVKVIIWLFSHFHICLTNCSSLALSVVGRSQPTHPGWIYLLHWPLGTPSSYRLWFQANFYG